MMSNDTESSSSSSSTTALDVVDATRTHRAYLRPVSSFLHFAANHRAVVATRRVVIDSSACCDVQKVQTFPTTGGGASYRDSRPTRRCRRRRRTRTTPRSPRSLGYARPRNRSRRSRAMDARCVNSSCLQIKSVHAVTRARTRTSRALTDRGVSRTINTDCVIAVTRVGSRTNRGNTRRCDWR